MMRDTTAVLKVVAAVEKYPRYGSICGKLNGQTTDVSNYRIFLVQFFLYFFPHFISHHINKGLMLTHTLFLCMSLFLLPPSKSFLDRFIINVIIFFLATRSGTRACF